MAQGKTVSDAYDTIVGKVLIERGWVTRDQVVECMKEISTVDEAAGAEGSKSRLTDLLVSRGLVRERQVDAVREEVSKILESSHEYAVVRKGDAQLGQLLVKAGHATKEQLVEALSIQQHASSKGGLVPRLGEILLQKGFCTFAAIEDTIRSQKQKTPLQCSSCGAAYQVVDYDPKKRYLCKKCTGPLGPPGQAPAGVPEEVTRASANPRNLLGKYVAVRELGRGGMGVVYKAWDTALRRWTALKVLLGTGAKEEIQRFFREAQTAAALRHPNIVGIYEVVTVGDKHIIAMEYVDGSSLAGDRLPARKAAEILAQVARAVEYAHSKGIIHRDLKPHNVMVDREGKPYVMDFGLAKSLEGASHITMAGTVVGTPSYMAPEQAEGRISQVDRQSDVYSLGAVLFEVLTGRPPFKGVNPVETMQKVLNEDAPPPSQLAPVPKDLERVVLKCLEKEKARRYPSAKAVADDLERFVGGRDVEARPVPVGARLAKRMRRAWAPVLALGACALVLVLGGVMALSGGGKEKEVRGLLLEGDRLMERGDPRAARVRYEAARFLDPENPAVRMKLEECTRAITDLEAAERRAKEAEARKAEEARKKREDGRRKAQPEFDQGRSKLTRARTDLYRTGADLHRVDQLLQEAADHFGRALTHYPEHAEAFHLRGQTQYLRHHYAAAEKDFAAAIGHERDLTAALYDRARVYIDLATEARSLSGLSGSADEEARVWREKAKADLQAYRQTGGGDPEQTALAEALLACSEAQYHKVIQVCERLIARQTTNEEVFKLKADAHHALGDQAKDEAARKACFRQAADAYGEAIAKRVNYPEAYLQRGHMLFHLGQNDAAVKDMEKAAAMHKPTASWYAQRGAIQHEMGRNKEALEDFERAHQLNPNDRGILNNIGILHLRQKNYSKAVEFFDRVLRAEPNSVDALANRGSARHGMGDSQAALEDFERALKLEPRRTRLYLNTGQVYLSRREWLKAEEDFTLFLRDHPKGDGGYFSRGVARFNQEKFRDAVADWQKCLELGSKRADECRDRIAEAKRRLGD